MESLNRDATGDFSHRSLPIPEGVSAPAVALSLESVLDQATERYSRGLARRSARSRAERQSFESGSALVLAPPVGALAPLIPVRLKWRGLDVSEEFQLYAARVARGEELAPWRGNVLAQPCADFVWHPDTPLTPYARRTVSAAQSSSWVRVLGVIALAAVAVLGIGTAVANQDQDADSLPPDWVPAPEAAAAPEPAGAPPPAPAVLQVEPQSALAKSDPSESSLPVKATLPPAAQRRPRRATPAIPSAPPPLRSAAAWPTLQPQQAAADGSAAPPRQEPATAPAPAGPASESSLLLEVPPF
jgi:hypothetical protein